MRKIGLIFKLEVKGKVISKAIGVIAKTRTESKEVEQR